MKKDCFGGPLSLANLGCTSLAVFTLGLVVACGPTKSPQKTNPASSTGTVTFSGTLLGKSLSFQDAISGEDSGATVVVISDWAGLCADTQSCAVKANGDDVAFIFNSVAAVGTYTVADFSEIQFAEYDATCNSPAGASAASGSVDITRADAKGVAGTFDLTFAGGDHVTGSFDAPTCSGTPTACSTTNCR